MMMKRLATSPAALTTCKAILLGVSDTSPASRRTKYYGQRWNLLLDEKAYANDANGSIIIPGAAKAKRSLADDLRQLFW